MRRARPIVLLIFGFVVAVFTTFWILLEPLPRVTVSLIGNLQGTNGTNFCTFAVTNHASQPMEFVLGWPKPAPLPAGHAVTWVEHPSVNFVLEPHSGQHATLALEQLPRRAVLHYRAIIGMREFKWRSLGARYGLCKPIPENWQSLTIQTSRE